MSAEMISICVFGSIARKTADCLSDRDVLIVGEDNAQRHNLKLSWMSSGWNVSCFTQSHLTSMSNFGSLFIQHLKQEGSVIKDDGFLADLLRNYQPRGDYKGQLLHALPPLTWTCNVIGIWQRLCAADILFVTIRNIGVLESAMQGKCVFDFDLIVRLLAEVVGIPEVEQNAIRQLRRYKVSYRDRIPANIDNLDWHLTTCASWKIFTYFQDKYTSSEASDFTPNGYNKLRKAELDLVKNLDPRTLDSQLPGQKNYELWKLICHPADYPKMQEFYNCKVSLQNMGQHSLHND